MDYKGAIAILVFGEMYGRADDFYDNNLALGITRMVPKTRLLIS
jgi:hypothetical protein